MSAARIPPIGRIRRTARWCTWGVFTHKVPSPHAHYLCWTGMMDRWECAAFAEWLKKSVA